MDLWFTEYHTENARFSFKLDKVLISVESEFQRIDVFDSYDFGRVLVLDGYLMLTEKDEFIYHEMMTHVPMAVNPEIRDVLVIGAGDGGVVRELTRYDSIKRIDMVEIDKLVVDVCREYLPQTSCKLDDPRVHIYYDNGVEFVRKKDNEYDLIIVDSTDPFGPGEDLFTKEFYGNCFKALKASGIMINQHESPYYPNDALAMQKAHRLLKSIFPKALIYQAHIPTYPSGHWLFGFSSKALDPISDLSANWDTLGLKTRYYNTDLHKGCFALPNYVKELLENA
ncbi:spermidine synthase [Clostridium thermosuccinogenes]|jgi:spermidine synthase|uniref:Polyamine aminopropyltransferase n=1 Tax=Clostridium thermosuccinogenes TaxID=84032 RepID=A0A2K2EXS2_9CLOT|nr:polyamine aminopropyltransferase [Pseudoclostridium thermosuccinogenes]AUS98040.1 spermidine synthase [Pseudoclostridium thermosuccinogenes]PNT91333.1 spermidine synthase [Pseudoclostridium thermosuccinogenes]PNT95711.1 spermidine synthase [Pseudoclostridium thermosuccinogenes]PNT96968.1 spermidine synthase [Pseudoclostridium thermosuccinogenes]